MKRLLLILTLLSVILSTATFSQQVTITIFGGSDSVSFPTSGANQIILGDTQPTQKTYTFADIESFSKINVTYQTTGQCYNYMVDNDGDGTPETTVYECGTPQLCITVGTATQQCKPLVMQGAFPKSGQQKLTYTLLQPITSGTIDFSYNTYQSRGMPQIKIIRLDWDGGISGSVVKPLNFFRNKTGPVTLGRISNLISTQGYFGDFKTASTDNKVFPYFAPDQSYIPKKSLQTTPAPSDLLIACLNSDNAVDAVGEPLCDYQKEEQCRLQNSDWYNGACCGDAPVNPEAETTPSQCKYYGTVAFPSGNRVMNAICGKSGNNWVWAGQLDSGAITDFTSCGAMTQVVSTGTGFITCGNTQNTAGITVSQLTGTQNIAGHEYWCEGSQLRECGGSNPYSQSQYALKTGNKTTVNSESYYCKSSGALSKTLDGDEQGCLLAGFAWTGSKCCGEPNDLLKTYSDPTGNGVCINNQIVSQGNIIGIDQNILIHNGAYYYCDTQRQTGTTGTTTLADFPGVNINEYGSCGAPLSNVLTIGADKNAVCTPQSKWQFVNFTQTSNIKQTAWTPSSSQEQQGCCPTAMCWDGTRCKSVGDFVSTGDRGFVCQ